MSDRDDFLSRWSRRKREAAEQATSAEKPKAPAIAERKDAEHNDAAPADTSATANRQAELQPKPVAAEPVFDISKLPSLDSIGPSTDIRMFLQPGVPASLSRAALRRAWSADPAIRDFIGLSENSWDFTAPDQVAGFGPMLPTDDVKQMLAQIFGGAKKPEAENEVPEVAAHEPEALEKTADLEAEPTDAESFPAAESASAQIADTTDTAHPEELPHRTQNDFASQHEESKVMEPASRNRRRHGGALPT